ncbi:MAG: cell division protein ZapA [Acidobacteria bacterium]|nr:cell division protein ZapA [Acidobacteriota bacterium]
MEPSADKKLVRVTIFQQAYTLRSSGEPGETEALAEAVDSLMHQISSRAAGADSARIAVLACLHLADKVRQLEKDYDALNARIAALDERVANTLKID